ncbi:Uncharacterised protein [Legionella beliardensis]|uniref:Uncharacterized protein n=1 Tax=Legionella beliardensis TaxID=91822 RepID=A0A378I0V3_9GAMM|nr:hypothetical protein [Legionella beliardensis]STX28295.1 Uncharacterised protein [Legionella beliardensis]
MKTTGKQANRDIYSYNNPIYIKSFGLACDKIYEADFTRLEKNARFALSLDDEYMAILQAGKAAIEYGVAGLILYINIYIKILEKSVNNGELVEQEVITLLGYVKFARQMLAKKESKALKSIEIIYGDDQYTTLSYWEEKEGQLMQFLNKNGIDLIKAESDKVTNLLLQKSFVMH